LEVLLEVPSEVERWGEVVEPEEAVVAEVEVEVEDGSHRVQILARHLR
jgi:hypothetical protein